MIQTIENNPAQESRRGSRARVHGRSPRASARGFLSVVVLGGWCACVTATAFAADAKADPKAAQFEALAQAITQNAAAAGEQQIVELVTLARELGRPYAANIAIKTWLARTPSPSPAAMRAMVGQAK